MYYNKYILFSDQYIRFDINTPANYLKQFMFECWKMKKPDLVISLIGGAKLFKSHERIEIEFIDGIIKLAIQASKQKRNSFDNKQNLKISFYRKISGDRFSC